MVRHVLSRVEGHVLSRAEGVADALAECLDLIRSGNDIEACLARFPRYRRELLPLIEVALKVRPLSQNDESSVRSRGGESRRERLPLVWQAEESASALESRRDLRTLAAVLRQAQDAVRSFGSIMLSQSRDGHLQARRITRQNETESLSHSRSLPRKARTGQASLDEVLAF